MDPLSVLGSVAGLLSLTIEVSKLIHDQFHTFKHAAKDAASLLEELDLLCEVLKNVKAFLEASLSNGQTFQEDSVFVKTIKCCENQIIVIRVRLKKLSEKKGFAQVVEKGKWFYEHDEHQRLVETLHRYIVVFQMSLSVDGTKLLLSSTDDAAKEIKILQRMVGLMRNSQIADTDSRRLDDLLDAISSLADVPDNLAEVNTIVKRIDNNLQVEDSMKILDWLSPLNFWAKQQDAKSIREEGTSEWILEEPVYKDWVRGAQRVLWCSGMPGAGKTIIASAIIDQISDELCNANTALGFVYFNYKQSSEQTLENIMRSLTKQVLLDRPLPDKLQLMYENHRKKGTRLTVVECLELLQAQAASSRKIFLVVDALDEYDGSTEKFLGHLLGLPSTVSILITSRHVPSIEQQLKQSSRIEIIANNADMHIYLEREIQRTDRLRKHTQKDPSLIQEIQDKVVIAAQGMFLVAQLHIDALSHKQSPNTVRKALQNLPQKLDQIYEEAMERISAQNADDKDLAYRILTWISFSFRPLSVIEMRNAISIELEDNSIEEGDLIPEDILISVCAGLIIIDEQSDVIRLIHYTTQDYFNRHRETHFPNGHKDIMAICITYLSFDVFKHGCCENEKQFQIRQRENPLFIYAATNWGNHARTANEDIVQLLRFLSLKSNLFSAVQALFDESERGSIFYYNNPYSISALWVAATFGLVKTMEKLLESYAKIDMRSINGETALFAASSKGYDSAVKLLITGGADVNIGRSPFVETALSAAAERGDEAIVRMLLRGGADVNAKIFGEGTPLSRAATQGHEAVAQLLIEWGADVNIKIHWNQTALFAAAHKGNEAIVRLLIERGADVNAKDDVNRTALFDAALAGHEAIIRLLLARGADVNAKDNRNRTVLFEAAPYRGNEAVLQLFIERGVDVNSEDDWNKTALFEAAYNGNEAAVRLLIEKGADISRSDTEGSTAFLLASRLKDDESAQVLLEHGADFAAKDQSGRNALHIAAETGSENLVKILLEKGADANAASNKGEMALHIAARDRRKEMVQLLLDHGAEIDAKDPNGTTALGIAMDYRQVDIVRLLLEQGADFRIKHFKGRNGLHIAAAYGYAEIVQLLLQKGADPDVEDNDGKTALDYAIEENHGHIAALLTPLSQRPGRAPAQSERALIEAVNSPHGNN